MNTEYACDITYCVVSYLIIHEYTLNFTGSKSLNLVHAVNSKCKVSVYILQIEATHTNSFGWRKVWLLKSRTEIGSCSRSLQRANVGVVYQNITCTGDRHRQMTPRMCIRVFVLNANIVDSVHEWLDDIDRTLDMATI